ncbi:MAG: nuclear transport factor 2 family protein [Candidatus Thorarchaeota archaeon]|nr:nuclear transport factor 2 family protein [Candidatus Thorarchaeota archaeon]
MTPDRVHEAHIIFLRNGLMVLSKVRYRDWLKIQDEYDNYATSLGPWGIDAIISFFEDEYKEEKNWAFSRNEIQSFMESDENIIASDNGLDLLTNPSAVALRFNLMINTRNLDGLSELMTDDHTFIDSSNDVHAGKSEMVPGWKEFFEKYPDYRNIFTWVAVRNDTVLIIGYSTCSEPILDGPALWTAEARNGRLSEWRVYLDTPENRAALELPQGNEA